MVKYIKGLLIGIFSIIFFYTFSIIGSSVFLLFTGKNPIKIYHIIHTAKLTHTFINNQALLMLSGDLFVIIIILVLIYFLKKYNLKKQLKITTFKANKLLVIIPLAIGVAVVFSLISALFCNIIGVHTSRTLKIITNMNNFISYLSTIITAPIAEELVFRGFLFNYLDRTISRKFAIVLSSLFFAIAHANLHQGIYVFFLGIALALIYVYTDSIFGSILFHGIANFTTILGVPLLKTILTNKLGSNIGTGIFGISFILGGYILIFLSIYIYKKLTSKTKRMKYLIISILLLLFSISQILTLL